MTQTPSATEKFIQEVADGSLNSVVEMRKRISDIAKSEGSDEHDVWESAETGLTGEYLRATLPKKRVSKLKWLGIIIAGALTGAQVIGISGARGLGALPMVMMVASGVGFIALVLLVFKPTLASVVRKAVGVVLAMAFAITASLVASAISNTKVPDFPVFIWILSLGFLLGMSVITWMGARSVEKELSKEAAEQTQIRDRHELLLRAEPAPSSDKDEDVSASTDAAEARGRRKYVPFWPFQARK